jgi:hypothetical protein
MSEGSSARFFNHFGALRAKSKKSTWPTVMIDTDGAGHLVLRASLTPDSGKEKEKIPHFESLEKAHKHSFDFASFRKHLESGADIRQAEQ